MTRRVIFIFIFLIFAAVISAGFFVYGNKILAAEESTLVINEIFAFNSSDYDWIEVYNKSDNDIDLSSWIFYENSTNHSLKEYAGLGFIVKSHDYVIIANNPEKLLASSSFSGLIVDSSFDLRKDGEEIGLKENKDSDFVEKFTYPPFMEAYSWERIDPNLSAELNSNWKNNENGSMGLINLFYLYSNQPPTAVATSSKTVAEVDEEIDFDGSDSTDIDGSIVDWLWDLAGEVIHGQTVNKSFNSTGTKPIYFWAVDDDQETSSPVFFNLEIIPKAGDSATTTATTTEETATTTEAVINPGDIVINETYPAPPTGQNEWVELYNRTTSTIDLTGLLLLNIDGGKFVTTTLSGTLTAGGYLAIEDITGSLNNSGDTVVLQKAATIISQTVYGSFDSSESWARTDSGDYARTIQITKGAANAIVVKPASNSGASSYVAKTETPAATTTATSTAATATSSPSVIDYKDKIIINEIFPNPVGSDNEEFIELKNLSGQDIALNGFYLSDNTKIKHLIKAADQIILSAGGLAIIKRTTSGVALNNSGFEVVNLFDPEGELLDRVTYEAAKSEGQAYAKTESGEWRWTPTPTPGEENVFANQEQVLAAAVEIAVSKAKTTAKKASVSYGQIGWADLDELADTAKIVLTGVVSVEPGVLGSQFFYLSGGEAYPGRGIQVYSYKKDFPNLKIGDQVTVTGELSTAAAGRRLKTKTAQDIKVIAAGELKPVPAGISDLNEESIGGLFQVEGEVIEIKSRNLVLAAGEEELPVYFPAGIDVKALNLKTGNKIKISGILMDNKNDRQLRPRNANDIEIISGEVKGEFEKSATPPSGRINYYLAAVIGFLALSNLAIFLKLKKPPLN